MSEQCSICYEDLGPAKRKATSNQCEHAFCLACLELWALKSNTCPCCRQEFAGINVGGKRKRTITVNDLRLKETEVRKKGKKRLRVYLKREILDKGFALRMTTVVRPTATPLQRWVRIPLDRVQEGDVSTSLGIEALCKHGVMDKPGSRTLPIEL
jgi:hypothetical protein